MEPLTPIVNEPRDSGAGMMPICHLGASPLYPTRYIRGKATASWRHYLNNFSGRNNRLRELQTESMTVWADPGVRERTLPRGKGMMHLPRDPHNKIYPTLSPRYSYKALRRCEAPEKSLYRSSERSLTPSVPSRTDLIVY